MPKGFSFTCAPLPKVVYELLRVVATKESCTQRTIVTAGVLALHRLKEVAPEHLRDVLDEAKKLCPPRNATTPAA